MSDIMNEYADLVTEVTHLKAELEECKSPIMTHDQKISYWEDEHKKTLADRDHYRALCEKMRAAFVFIRDYTYTDALGPELRAQNERVHRMAKEALALFDAKGAGKP